VERTLNPYKSYQKQNGPTSQTRIDVVLSLYEAVIERLEKALAALGSNEQSTLKKQVAACVIGLSGLASAAEGREDEVAVSLRRLYRFIANCLADPTESNLKAGLNLLRTLHEGFLTVRPQALELERRGEIPPIGMKGTFQVSA
jgi:flagellin-specific chaperone FliS